MIKKNRIVALITFVIMVLVNVLGNVIPIKGVTTGEVSDLYENLFAPIGLTFSIWGVIYILLFIYTLYQLGIKKTENEAVKDKIAIFFSISSVLNAIWIFMWHYELMALSVVVMLLILLCLMIIKNIIYKSNLQGFERGIIGLPFSIYFGWITIASIANITTYFVSEDWDPIVMGEVGWTLLILAIGTLIVGLTMVRFKDKVYGLVGIWAYVGILLKHIMSSGYEGEYISIIIGTTTCIILLVFIEIKLIFIKKPLIE